MHTHTHTIHIHAITIDEKDDTDFQEWEGSTRGLGVGRHKGEILIIL